MKIKFDKFSFEMTDKDTQNILNMFRYFNSLSEKEQVKLVAFILGVPYLLSTMGMNVYKTIKEERRKDKILEEKCKLELKTAEQISELINEQEE